VDRFQIIKGEELPPEEIKLPLQDVRPTAIIVFWDEEFPCKIYNLAFSSGARRVATSLTVSFVAKYDVIPSIPIRTLLGNHVSIKIPQKDSTYSIKNVLITSIDYVDKIEDAEWDITLSGTY
jgi:hypothetical protein